MYIRTRIVTLSSFCRATADARPRLCGRLVIITTPSDSHCNIHLYIHLHTSYIYLYPRATTFLTTTACCRTTAELTALLVVATHHV